jgi:putative Holliday junction resolvase
VNAPVADVQTLLGFDYGIKRIGVAVGQTVTATARPLAVLACRQGQPLWSQIDALIAQWEPAALVIGVPYLADGRAGDTARRAQAFGDALAARYHLPIHHCDEHLSSWAAQTRSRHPHELDAQAASVILESYMEQLA